MICFYILLYSFTQQLSNPNGCLGDEFTLDD